jgi:hypothetical protein
VSLSPVQRVRRVLLLCVHCRRNLVYHRIGHELSGDWNTPSQSYRREFWATEIGNNLDTCVVEWCKLFADTKSKHHWQKVVSNKEKFLSMFYAKTSSNKKQFQDFISEVRHYRDKFVAHLDDETEMQIPNLDFVQSSTVFLFGYLVEEEITPANLQGLPTTQDQLSVYLSSCGEAARKEILMTASKA